MVPAFIYLQLVPHPSFYKSKYGYDDNCFPVASWISRSSITLPVCHHLNMEDKEYMVKSVRKTLEGGGEII
jgi:dTDP-4-amino-4,6-dideoxygalactose transaminase|tara:strand:+ start:489 stop:701 length:213 start_codon:yes stop_codon:yes gene_type:complete